MGSVWKAKPGQSKMGSERWNRGNNQRGHKSGVNNVDSEVTKSSSLAQGESWGTVDLYYMLELSPYPFFSTPPNSLHLAFADSCVPFMLRHRFCQDTFPNSSHGFPWPFVLSESLPVSTQPLLIHCLFTYQSPSPVNKLPEQDDVYLFTTQCLAVSGAQ